MARFRRLDLRDAAASVIRGFVATLEPFGDASLNITSGAPIHKRVDAKPQSPEQSIAMVLSDPRRYLVCLRGEDHTECC